MSRAVPNYRRHQTGQAYVRTKRLNGGRNVYLGVYRSAASLEYYQRILKQLAAMDAGAPPPAKEAISLNTSIAGLVDAYTDWAKDYYGESGEYQEMVYALRPLFDLYANLPVGDFTPEHLELIQQHMISLDLARTTINHRVSRIRRMFKWGVRKGYADINKHLALQTVDGLRRGRTEARESHKVGPVAFEAVQATLPFLSPVVATMVQVHLNCGMRSQDVCLMRPCDIDQSDEVWIYRPHKFKTKHLGLSRVVAIPRPIQHLIAPYLERETERYLFEPREAGLWRCPKPGRKTPLYPSEVRRREARKKASTRSWNACYDKDTYGRAVQHGIAAAAKQGVQIDHWHPHQLRHAMGTAIAQTLGAQQAQRYLGHARLETTGIYAQSQVKELIAIARLMEESILPAMGQMAQINGKSLKV